MNLAEAYSLEWFRHDFKDLGPEFDLAALAIARMWDWTSVLDVGCGPGLLLEGLYRCGFREIYGVDGSPNALEYAKEREVVAYVRERMRLLDLRDPDDADYTSAQRYGLVVCTEVAEHVEVAHADRFVAFLAKRVGRPHGALIFTAAPPGQDGHHHVNCQPLEYWSERFADHGLIYDMPTTTELVERWRKLARLSHMRRNVAVYR